ncbi:MAG: zinc metalloprotease HtpX [Methanomicrobiales archaeon]|nr:zinc metalloprotease HtpX [Methanomicrobiales archaeon]
MQWKRDFGLTWRIWMTLLLLLLVYLVFLGVLSALGVGWEFLILLAGGMAFFQYFFSDRLVLWSTGARIVGEDEYPELHRMVERLSAEAGIPKPRVAVVPSPVPNAFATGRNPKNAVVAATDSLMRILNRDELEAVLAHELSHVRYRDVFTLTVASFISMVAFILVRNWFFMGMFSGGGRREGGNPWIIVFLVSIVVWVVSTLLIRALSRYREYAADRGSAILTGRPRALANALEKISGRMEYVAPQKKQEIEGANAFFIIPALSGSTLMELFSTHPPLEKRLAALENIEREMKGY